MPQLSPASEAQAAPSKSQLLFTLSSLSFTLVGFGLFLAGIAEAPSHHSLTLVDGGVAMVATVPFIVMGFLGRRRRLLG